MCALSSGFFLCSWNKYLRSIYLIHEARFGRDYITWWQIGFGQLYTVAFRTRYSSFGMLNIDHQMNLLMLCYNFFLLCYHHIWFGIDLSFSPFLFLPVISVCCIHTITVYMKSYLSCKSCRVCCLKVHFTLKKSIVR
jgi:hypothetical protein